MFFFDRGYVKWAKHQNTVCFERKPYFLLQLGDTCWGCVILTGIKRMQWGRHSFLFSVSLSLEWVQWSDWGYLSLCISVTEGRLPIHLLDSLIDRHVFYYLVQSFCTSAVAKNTLIGNKTPPIWPKSFCPRKQWIDTSMIYHVLPQHIDKHLLRSSPDRYCGTYSGWDLLCWWVKPSYFGQPRYIIPFTN